RRADAHALHTGDRRPLGSGIAHGDDRRHAGAEQHQQADVHLGRGDPGHGPRPEHRDRGLRAGKGEWGMGNDPARHVWVMAASLAATAVLSFAIGVMATMWSYSAPAPAAPAMAASPPAAMALEPPMPVSAPEAAALAPEIFG